LFFLGSVWDAPGQGGGVKARAEAAKRPEGLDADAARCTLGGAEEDAV
jgi:hypothetical protein